MGDGMSGAVATKSGFAVYRLSSARQANVCVASLDLEIFAPLNGLDLRPVNNETYQFGKAFSEGDFCACGQMLIPSGGEKPTKNTRANAMVGLRAAFRVRWD
jgi:hypothetical protein